ncbi:MAG TPA: metallophosphoesterase family protein [Gaiellaceae bacterium]
MRVAALYDIHGMVVPLEAVLAELGDVDAVLIGGDAVSGPQPSETLDLLRSLELQTLWIRGNGERALGPDAADAVMGGDEAEVSLRFTASQLSADDRNWLVQLPETCVLDIDGLGETLFCHASPRNDLDIVTPGTPDARVVTLLEGVPQRVVVAGHTHMQDDREIGGTRWINPGSVGMPYEGEVAAFWAVLGPDVELRRTPFDVERSAEAVLASGWPGAQAFVEENIRAAVAREEVITLFEQIAAERGER